VCEEGAYNLDRDLFYGHMCRVDGVTLGEETEEQPDGVAVTALGVQGEVAVRHHFLEQETADEGTEQVAIRHGPSFLSVPTMA